MKVLVVGEGASELDGALRELVTRLASSDVDIEQDKVSRSGVHVLHGKGNGYFKRAVRWIIEAEKRGYEALVLVIDQDGRQERTKQLTEAQEYTGRTLRRAFGVAIRTFDAWMLADESALTKVLEFSVNRQSDPETIRNPKEAFRNLKEQMRVQRNPAEMYSEIAQLMNLETLEMRCPDGFVPFAERVRAL